MTDWPATVSVPVRGKASGFAVTLNVTGLAPEPVPGLVTVIQAALLVALHEHSVPVTTLRVRLVLNGPIDTLVGDTVLGQLPPSWLTDTVWPATISVPVRGPDDVFGSINMVVQPKPVPLAPLEIVIQLAALTAVHEHRVPVTMPMVRVPDVDGAVNEVGVKV